MLLKIGQIYNMKESLAKLFRHDIPIGVAFNLRKTAENIEANLKEFETSRQDFIYKYGDKDANDMMTVPADKLPEFHKEMKILLDRDIEVPVYPISVSDLEGMKLSVQDMINLSMFFRE